jgi:transglutaminase-like putative cysteine protease
MSWLRIIHETIYRYSRAVQFGPHRLVLRPREGHDVRVEQMQLEITPAFELEWSRDVFGNSVATAHFSQSGDQLRIRSDVVLLQTAPFPSGAERNVGRIAFPVRFSEEEAVVAAAYIQSTYPENSVLVSEWTSKVIDPSTESAEHVVAAVAREIKRTIEYQRRDVRGVQIPAETLTLGSGSCRDMATLMLEALRSLGLPARFVSGYLDCPASEAGHASTHAWAEAYLPEIGWTGYDPMLGERTSHRHIVTGVSNHPRGVMPVSGTYFDQKEVYVGMSVSVQTQRLEKHTVGPLHRISPED